MSDLVGYGSSDEEDEGGAKDSHVSNTTVQNHLLNGAAIGPSIPIQEDLGNKDASALPSPYTTNYSIIRDMTLPTVPNLEIPPSPPGSPSPGIDKKFAHFLELKKKGVHFNEKLARSSALKNPALLQKLMASAGMEEDEQYETVLDKSLWDPSQFPSWAYKEALAQSQQKVLAKKEEERKKAKRDAIDFVSASEQPSRAHTPAGEGGPRLRGSATERVMAGLDRDRGRSPQTSNMASRSAGERRVR